MTDHRRRARRCSTSPALLLHAGPDGRVPTSRASPTSRVSRARSICVGEATTYLFWLEGTLDLGDGAPEPAAPPEGATATTLSTDRDCAEAWRAGRDEFDGWLTVDHDGRTPIADGAAARRGRRSGLLRAAGRGDRQERRRPRPALSRQSTGSSARCTRTAPCRALRGVVRRPDLHASPSRRDPQLAVTTREAPGIPAPRIVPLMTATRRMQPTPEQARRARRRSSSEIVERSAAATRRFRLAFVLTWIVVLGLGSPSFAGDATSTPSSSPNGCRSSSAASAITIVVSVALDHLRHSSRAHRRARSAVATARPSTRSRRSTCRSSAARRCSSRSIFVYLALPQIIPASLSCPPIYARHHRAGFNYGAYMTEIFRAGIQAVPRGQSEAARRPGHARVARHAPHRPAAGHPDRHPGDRQRVHRDDQGLGAGLDHRCPGAAVARPARRPARTSTRSRRSSSRRSSTGC